MSFSISRWVGVSLDVKVFVSWPIMVNVACLLKLGLSCWECLPIFLVCWLLKVVGFRTCLQQSDLKFVRYGENFPDFSFCIFLFFFLTMLLPINSLRFLFRLNAVIGWQLNISLRDSFIFSKFKYFCITLLMFGQKQL